MKIIDSENLAALTGKGDVLYLKSPPLSVIRLCHTGGTTLNVQVSGENYGAGKPMQKRSHQTDVVIIGAGPIGMTLALDLAARGVRSTIVERTDGSISTPKLGLVSIRTMEIFRRLGLSSRVRATRFNRNYGLSMVYTTTITGHFLGSIPYPSLREERPVDESPETKWRCSQLFLNPMLQAQVARTRLVNHIRLTSFESFEENEHGVTVMLKDETDGSRMQVEALYLVGCDGAGSSVRRQLGIPMEGKNKLDYSVAIFFRCEAFSISHKMGDAERYFVMDENGWWGNISAMDGHELWRLTVVTSEENVKEVQDNADAWIRRALGTDQIPFELISALVWRRSELIATNFQTRRVFLAGDSAHTMSPTGGFGMNTGMGDVDNLGWKLAATIEGWAGPELLETYTQERHPIACRNAAASTHNYQQLKSVADCKGIDEDTPRGEAVRKAVGESIVGATRTEWETLGIHLGYRYEGSGAVVPDGTDEPADDSRWYVQTSRPGHRAPHAWISGGGPFGLSTLDLFGREYVLLRFGDKPRSAAGLQAAALARGIPFRIHDVNSATIGKLYEKRLVLVRPDGHVAWRSDEEPADADALWNALVGVAHR